MCRISVESSKVITGSAVVVKNVSPYAIYGGNPARLVKYRFDPELIDHMMEMTMY